MELAFWWGADDKPINKHTLFREEEMAVMKKCNIQYLLNAESHFKALRCTSYRYLILTVTL